MAPDLIEARALVVSREQTAAELMERSIEAARQPAMHRALLRTRFDEASVVARKTDQAARAGTPVPLLAGLAVTVKDLFDIAGEVTTAGSRVLQDAPPARLDAVAVGRLCTAGAALLGRTNMSEFAFSGVGINPHFGTPINAATAALDPIERIPGGSTSGGAVSVAAGAAWAALGSDTGGSIRIPAALQGLVGFKNTARLTPTAGALPLSTTLDTVCAVTRSVRDAVLMHEVLADRPVSLAGRPLSRCTLAVPQTLMLDGVAPAVAGAFERTLGRLRDHGATIVELRLPELGELAGFNSAGGFAAAESWALHRRRLGLHGELYDPRVALRMRRGEAMGAADYIDLLESRRDWTARMLSSMRGYDALLSPTVPCLAAPLTPLQEDETAFFSANALLLRNPSVVNFLDGCALSLPCHEAGEMPVGVMVWSSALQDDVVLDIGLAIEAALAAP